MPATAVSAATYPGWRAARSGTTQAYRASLPAGRWALYGVPPCRSSAGPGLSGARLRAVLINDT
jgi:hypothetical protein